MVKRKCGPIRVMVVEDSPTTVVYGMSGVAAKRKVVDYILAVDQVGPTLQELIKKGA